MFGKLVRLLSLFAVIYILLVPTKSRSIIWPVDNPEFYSGDSSQQHKISGLFGEYRPSGADHFHGGVDIPDPNGTSIYSVLTGVVVDTSTTYQRIDIRNEWDPDKYVWDVFSYVHVYWTINIVPGDSIIDDLSLNGWHWNGDTENWEWPRHLPVAYIASYPSGDHLHFERIYYDYFLGGYFPDDYYYKWNPLVCGRTCLSPFSDTTTPKFDTISSSTDWIKFYDHQYGSQLSLSGQGTYNDPFLIRDSSFDVRIHAHDEINDETNASGDPYKLALYGVYWELRWEGSLIINESRIPFYFPYLSKMDSPNHLVVEGFEFIYDTLQSTISDHYYWITNFYDNDWDFFEGLEFEGGKDSSIISENVLDPEQKYLFKICLYDMKYNEKCDSIWILYKTTDVEDREEIAMVSDRFSLFQNYPNPFNPTTTIPFIVPGKQKTVNTPIHTTLTIFNVLGQKVKTLVDEFKAPGLYNAIWDGKDNKGDEVASGIYLYRLESDDYKEVKKMILLK